MLHETVSVEHEHRRVLLRLRSIPGSSCRQPPEQGPAPPPEQPLDRKKQESPPLGPGATRQDDVKVKPWPPPRSGTIELHAEALGVSHVALGQIASDVMGQNQHLVHLFRGRHSLRRDHGKHVIVRDSRNSGTSEDDSQPRRQPKRSARLGHRPSPEDRISPSAIRRTIGEAKPSGVARAATAS